MEVAPRLLLSGRVGLSFKMNHDPHSILHFQDAILTSSNVPNWTVIQHVFREHVFILTICFVNNYVGVVRLNKPLLIYHTVDA